MYSLIEKWYSKVMPYLFKYKNGFFVLPYINNTPQLMWKSLQKMPFIKFAPQLNMSETNTPFLHAKMYFQEIEKDLVLFYNEIDYKKNVTYNHYRKKDIPATYYCLTVMLSDTSDRHLKTIVNDFHFQGLLWILHKPETVFRDYHFKHSQTKTAIIYFTDEWLQKYLERFPEKKNKFELFIRSKDHSIGRNLPTCVEGMALLNKVAGLMNEEVSTHRTIQLEEAIHQIMECFNTSVLQNIVHPELQILGNFNELKLIEVERILRENIYNEFPGITSLANHVGFSETKLKTDFRNLYGISVFQYYRAKQMEYAKEMIQQNVSTIKDLAQLFGYENASKFSIAFKKHHGVSPSELQKANKNTSQKVS